MKLKRYHYLFILVTLLLTLLLYSYSNIVRLVLIDFTNFRYVTPHLYLSGSLNKLDEDKIHTLLARARIRISEHYGSPKAKPKVYVVSSKEEARKFGLNDYPGMYLFAPWGDYLLLNIHTATLDVIAHELVHAEIVERVGYLARIRHIPTWFDEGVAMQVDYRKKYSHNHILSRAMFDRVTQLKSASDFWTASKKQNIENYRDSKSAVKELMNNMQESLYDLLSEIKSGNESILNNYVMETRQQLSS